MGIAMQTINEFDYALQSGNLANAVCAFAIVQTLVVLIAIGPGRGELAYAVHDNRRLTLGAIILFTLIYAALIYFFNNNQMLILGKGILSTELRSYLYWLGIMRYAAVVACGVAAFWVCGHFKVSGAETIKDS
jgi:hypothetical protein